MRPYPELVGALTKILDKISNSISVEYSGPAIRMYLAGGLAVNYYCGSRYTEDVDASFSNRPLLDFKEMTANYTRKDGTPTFLYLDPNYNTSFALLHENFEEDAIEWTGIGNENRRIQLYVVTPVDLAVSKIARFSEQDQEDILALTAAGLVTAGLLEKRALDALPNYIGNTAPIRENIRSISDRIKALTLGSGAL